MKIKIGFIYVRKRDGRLAPFDKTRIANAILKAMNVTKEGDEKDAERIADAVVQGLLKKYMRGGILIKDATPHIEEIQDLVETNLILMDFSKTAKAYILYRNERAKLREKRREIPEHVKKLAVESKKYFKNSLAEFIYYRSYSRWIEKEGRRETWIETVERFMNFMKENLGDKFSEDECSEIREAVLNQEVMPSMRLMWSAGDAARANNVSAYNCSFIAPRKLRDFAEIMYVSMCGTGIGFSVEHQNVHALPQIKRQTNHRKVSIHAIEDSKEGWAEAFYLGLRTWFNGGDVKFDFSKIRPAGARLKTMGGKTSGPKPLEDLLNYTRNKIFSRQGGRLSSLDVHDIVCKIGEIVVMGGVRRSALISLSDLNDPEMRTAKQGQFFITEPQRSMANNSAVYNDKPSTTDFMEEWLALAKSGTGERGIFNRGSLSKQLPERRWKTFKKDFATCGVNPCAEIVLKNYEFCNLTEVVARPKDTEKTLLKKVRLAAILGTYQATLTNFQFISKEWKKNCEEERLLGVSITGQWDCPAVRNPETLGKLKERAVEVNKEYAKRFGINQATAITAVKPSGTVSQLVDAASGLHPRHAKYYVRRVRVSASDSLFHMLRDQKAPYYPEVGQAEGSATTYVLEFPVAAPKRAIILNDLNAIEQLEYWKKVKLNYTEHNPSVTISVGDDEWLKVADWLYENWDILGGLSFLPRAEHVYALAPYEEIDEKTYKERLKNFPKIDFAQILLYEKDDETEGAKELACVGGVCEI
ncbi:MAG: ribonucleoside-triphosphate reductase [Candidatus Harrisonbacteria bacterium RIFCSPLOWO2_01_FULL_44_18]|uniref:ribonucleoside-triphosphate reductase (thioredoxin) n=1 Tax=Candidatus Harrisonbacteria bacterium RIFCSPLOWO2_01_FULL_44_18 TaxID=1798407 RepID=A0A1G1ZQ31_9BACT|nr:MAG: ribonucleoside-triphosphate reductase [Candidatus Harrisonbacteria bacterium RIFCSPLOWO2_01_FULL_44_18]